MFSLRRWTILCPLLALVIALGALAACRSEVADRDEFEVTLGVIKALGTISPYLSEQLGLFEAEGLKVNIVEFADGPSMMEGFASGHLDLAYGGLAPAAIWRGRGIPIKIVASTNSGGHVVVVRDGSDIHTLADLANRRVATPRTGSVTDTLFRGYALAHLAGLDPDRDLSISPGMPPDAMPVALLLTQEVDAIVTWEPFAAQSLIQFDDARILFNFNQHWHETFGSSYPVNVVSASESLITSRPGVLEKILRAHRATQDFINGEPERAAQMIAAELSLPVEIIALAGGNVEFTFAVAVEEAMAVLGFAHDLGYIDDIPDVDDLFDLTIHDRILSGE